MKEGRHSILFILNFWQNFKSGRENKKALANWMKTCVLLVLRFQGISGDEIQRLTGGSSPRHNGEFLCQTPATAFETLKRRN